MDCLLNKYTEGFGGLQGCFYPPYDPNYGRYDLPCTLYQPGSSMDYLIYLEDVDKICRDHDAQKSLLLQRTLENAPEKKRAVIDAVVARAYVLMVHRYGKYLVQSCLKNGMDEQIIQILQATRGKIVELSMNESGQHVICTALDACTTRVLLLEKAQMVNELVQSIGTSLLDPCATRVWQKLLRLRTEEVVESLNRELRGKWYGVILNKYGFYIMQTILLMSYVEQLKRPLIEELLQNIPKCLVTEYGSRSIQAIYEYGPVQYRKPIALHVLLNASIYNKIYSASKVVRLCLKKGDFSIHDEIKLVNGIPEEDYAFVC